MVWLEQLVAPSASRSHPTGGTGTIAPTLPFLKSFSWPLVISKHGCGDFRSTKLSLGGVCVIQPPPGTNCCLFPTETSRLRTHVLSPHGEVFLQTPATDCPLRSRQSWVLPEICPESATGLSLTPRSTCPPPFEELLVGH